MRNRIVICTFLTLYEGGKLTDVIFEMNYQTVGTIGDTENWADVSISCQNF
jgi:hypothetical protein